MVEFVDDNNLKVVGSQAVESFPAQGLDAGENVIPLAGLVAAHEKLAEVRSLKHI